MLPGAEILILLGVGVAAALTTWGVFALLKRSDAPTTVHGGFERTLDLTISYFSHYLLASILLGPLAGLAIGKATTILILPVLHFFAAIVMFPGAFLISYLGDRWLKRTWSRPRAWLAGVATVLGTWLLFFLNHFVKNGSDAILRQLMGEGLATVAEMVSVPMIASAVSLAVAWLLPSGRPQ